MSSTAILSTDRLTKVYGGKKKALDGLHLSVNQGEVFGYLGPNGAGKTTTIRLLLDLIRPSSGGAQVFGLNSVSDSKAIRARLGYLPAELNLWQNYTAQQVVSYAARARGLKDLSFAHELARRLEFDLTKKVKNYSTGNKRKLGLILAMMHKPDLLILDEPSSGLDPLMQHTFNQLMLEAKAGGQTVFLSSHVLNEVQAICDRVAILRDGQLQAVERVDRLTHADFRWVTLRLREAINADALKALSGASEITVEGQTAKLRLQGDFDPLLRAVAPYYVQDLQVQEPTLEEIFLTFYGADSSSAPSAVSGKASVK